MTEAVGVRIQVVLAGLPKIVSHRLGMNIERRFVLQTRRRQRVRRSSVSIARSPPSCAPRGGPSTYRPAASSSSPSWRRAGQPEGAVIRRSPSRCPPATRDRRTASSTSRGRCRGSTRPPPAPTPPAHFVAPLPVAIDTESGEWVWVDADRRRPGVRRRRPAEERSQHDAWRRSPGWPHEQGWTVLNVSTSRRSPLAASDDPALAVRVTPDDARRRDRGHAPARCWC